MPFHPSFPGTTLRSARGCSPLPPHSRLPLRAVHSGAAVVGVGCLAPHPPNGGPQNCPPPCEPGTEQRNRDSPGAPLAQPPEGREGDVLGGGDRPGREREGTGGEMPMGTAACGGFNLRARGSCERPIGAARCRKQYIQASYQTPLHVPALSDGRPHSRTPDGVRGRGWSEAVGREPGERGPAPLPLCSRLFGLV